MGYFYFQKLRNLFLRLLAPTVVLLITATTFADVIDSPTDVCDCPEIEGLSLDIRAILEEAYANQGEIPPFSFDEFNLLLAIQMSAESTQPCQESILANIDNFLPEEEPMPQHIFLDELGRTIPNGFIMNYREASLQGRLVVFRGEVNGEPRTFVLRRNDDGEVTVSSHRPNLNIESLNFEPIQEMPSPTMDGLVVENSGSLTLDPRNGQEGTQGRYNLTRTLETTNGNTLQFRGTLEGNELDGRSGIVTFGAGTTLSYDVDGYNETGSGPNGVDLELRANISERYEMGSGDLIDRDLSYGATLFGSEDTALSLDINERTYTDPTYNLQFGNAGREGQDIIAVRNAYSISGTSAGNGGPSSSEGKGGTEEEVPDEIEQDRGPLNQDLFHLGVGGLVGEEPREYSFMFAQTDEERGLYFTAYRNISSDALSLTGGGGTQDRRLNFSFDENPDSTTGSLAYQWQDSDPDRQVTQIISADFRQNPRDGEVTNLGYQREVVESETLEFEGDITASERITTTSGGQIGSNGTLTLTYDRSLTRDLSMPIPMRDEDDRPIEGSTVPYQFGSYEREMSGSFELMEDGDYTISGAFSEQIGYLPDRNSGEMRNIRGYSIGLTVAEQDGESQTSAELTLLNSDGVAGTPCETLGVGHSINSGPANNPGALIDIHDFNGYGQLLDGTNCGLYFERTRQGDHFLATIREVEVTDRDLGDGYRESVHVRQIGVGTRPNGANYGTMSVGWQFNFNTGSFVSR